MIEAAVKDTAHYTIIYNIQVNGKTITKAISKRAVKSLIYNSDSLEVPVSDSIWASSGRDWEKVMILTDKSETLGLQYIGGVEGKIDKEPIQETPAKEEAYLQLKKAAAELQCPFVYIAAGQLPIVDKSGRGARYSGMAYKY